VLVVIDEAYVEFVRDPKAPDALALQRARPNVVVLRTFSKAYGLAGLRVGYAVAHPLVAAALRKTALPFGVSSVAQDAAVASLAASQQLAERVAALVAERARVLDALGRQGWQLPDSHANFVWFPVGERTAELAAAFDTAGLSVRPLRHRRRAGHDRRARCQRPAARRCCIVRGGSRRRLGQPGSIVDPLG
jgi:histidinol-phosphate aminotransferase